MYYDLLSGLSMSVLLVDVFCSIVFFLLIMPLHSIVQARTILLLGGGDPGTVKKLRYNPLLHQGVFSFLFLLLFDFAWINPIPVRTNSFRGHKWQLFVCMISGQLVHIMFAILGGLGFNIISATLGVNYYFDSVTMALRVGGSSSYFGNILGIFFFTFMFANLLTFFVNLIPLPPFDGYYITRMFVSKKIRKKILNFHIIVIIGMLLLCASTLLQSIYKPYLNLLCVIITDITSRFVPR